MVYPKQLELFDLRTYTSEQSTATECEPKQVEETRLRVEYEQLELDLFSQRFCEALPELVRLAA